MRSGGSTAGRAGGATGASATTSEAFGALEDLPRCFFAVDVAAGTLAVVGGADSVVATVWSLFLTTESALSGIVVNQKSRSFTRTRPKATNRRIREITIRRR